MAGCYGLLRGGFESKLDTLATLRAPLNGKRYRPLVSAAALGGDAEQHDEGEDAEDPVHEQQDKEAFLLRLVHPHRVNHLRPPKQRGLSAEDRPAATRAMLGVLHHQVKKCHGLSQMQQVQLQ